MSKLQVSIKERIAEFATNDATQLTIPMTPISEVEEALEPLGFEREDIKTNGWQVDFWVNFVGENYTIQLEGSLYSGGYSLTKPTIETN